MLRILAGDAVDQITSDIMAKTRLYNENEIGSILKRATELSTKNESQANSGLSIEELKQLGTEAGLDPALIAAAARELMLPESRDRDKKFWGGPLSYSREVVLERELDPEDWEAMLPIIRRYFGDAGVVATRGKTFEWTHSGASNVKGHISVREVDGQSIMSVFWSEPTIAFPFFVPSLVFSIIAIPIIFEALALTGPVGIIAWLATVSTIFFAGRFGVSTFADRRIDNLEKMITQLEDIVMPSDGETGVRQHLGDERISETVLRDGTDQTVETAHLLTDDLGAKGREATPDDADPTRKHHTRQRT